MTIGELINLLEELKLEYGNREVVISVQREYEQPFSQDIFSIEYCPRDENIVIN